MISKQSKQSTDTLATKSEKGPAKAMRIPEWPPRMSRTAIGDDRWPTCSILTLPKLHLATLKKNI